jgi:hypothetical protein
MNAIGIIYPLYWLDYDVEITFPTHLALLKAQYYFENKFGMKVPTLLNEHKVDMGPSFLS